MSERHSESEEKREGKMAAELLLSSGILQANNNVPMAGEEVCSLTIWTNVCQECMQADNVDYKMVAGGIAGVKGQGSDKWS